MNSTTLPYIDAPFSYVFPQGQGNFFTLPANTEKRGNQVSIYTDAAFIWRATQVGFSAGSSGFEFQFADQAEKLYSSDYITSLQLSTDTAGGTPYPQFPEAEFPAGGGITVNLLNPFGGNSIFQLIFKGCKRFYDLEKACKMLPQRLYNPYAQPGLNGVNANMPDDEYIDVDTVYTYNSPLNFTGELVGQQLTLSGDSDFALRAIEMSIATPGSQTLVRFYNSQGYYLSDNYIDSSLYNSSLVQPFVVFPEMLFPASSRIMIDLNNVDTNGGTQSVQILFRGVKRYRASNLRKGR